MTIKGPFLIRLHRYKICKLCSVVDKVGLNCVDMYVRVIVGHLVMGIIIRVVHQDMKFSPHRHLYDIYDTITHTQPKEPNQHLTLKCFSFSYQMS